MAKKIEGDCKDCLSLDEGIEVTWKIESSQNHIQSSYCRYKKTGENEKAFQVCWDPSVYINKQ